MRLLGLSLGICSVTSLVLWACSSSKQPGQLGDTPPVNGSSDAGVWLDGTTSVDAGSVSINTLGIDFGTTECGKQAQPKTLIVQNTGVLPISWNSSFLRGDESPYAVSPTGGTLLGRESKIVTVAPKRIGVPASTATAAFNDTLIVNTDRVGDVPKTITISQAVSGAVLVFNPASINLGLVPVGQEGTASLSILNRGSGPADFSVTPSNPRFSIPNPPTTILPNATATMTVRYGSSAATLDTGVLTLSTPNTTALCANLPDPVPIQAEGTQGRALITPSDISFGTAGYVKCGDTAAPQQVTLKNTGSAAFKWTASTVATHTTFTPRPDNGTLQPGSSATVTITPSPINRPAQVGSDYYAGVLLVTTDAGDSLVVPMHQTAQGVILTSSSLGAPFDFGQVFVQQTAQSQISVANSGNMDVGITLSVGSSVFGVSPSSTVTILQNKSAPFSLSFTPPTIAPYTDSLSVGIPRDTILCADLPATTQLNGIGGNAISIAPMSFNFGIVNCGTSTPPQNFNITNQGTDATFRTSLVKGVNSPYTITTLSGTATNVDTHLPNGVTTVVVRPKLNQAVASTADNGQGDTLTVTVTGQETPTNYTIPLLQTARGTIWTTCYPSATSAGSCNGQPLATTITASGTPAFVLLGLDATKSNLNSAYELTIESLPPYPLADVTFVGSSQTFSGTLPPGQTGYVNLNLMARATVPLSAAQIRLTPKPVIDPNTGLPVLFLCADVPQPLPIVVKNQ